MPAHVDCFMRNHTTAGLIYRRREPCFSVAMLSRAKQLLSKLRIGFLQSATFRVKLLSYLPVSRRLGLDALQLHSEGIHVAGPNTGHDCR